MRSNRNNPLLTTSMAILVAVGFILATLGATRARQAQAGQRPPATANATSQPFTTYTMYAGLWRTDGGFVSTIRIKNVLTVGPLDVTPALFMADGTPYLLSPVHVPTSGVASLNINDALAAAPPPVASHISQYGSAALIWRYSSPGHVAASVTAIDVSRSLSFVFPFSEPMGHVMQQTVEGLWWKHDSGVPALLP